MLKELVAKNRSYRRFSENTPVELETLRQLVDLARLTPSAANLQPLKYLLACDPQSNQRIFDSLAWAGYLRDWPGPAEGERPAAYIVLLGDNEIAKNFGIDPGIAAQTILLGAAEQGLGGCMIASIRREDLRTALKIPAQYEIPLVIALGKPIENVILEPLNAAGEIKYYRDEAGTHHVPKRALDEIIVKFD